MPYRNLTRLRPVKSLKHVIDTNGAITGATPSQTDVVNVVNDPADTSTPQVAQGSTIHSIFLNVQVVGIIGAGGVDNVYMIVFKSPGDNINPPSVDSVGTSDSRRFVIHQEMMMTGQPGGNPGSSNIPRTLFKGVIKIPRGYKRNGYDDKLMVLIGHRAGEVTQKTNFCLQCIYKEFR